MMGTYHCLQQTKLRRDLSLARVVITIATNRTMRLPPAKWKGVGRGWTGRWVWLQIQCPAALRIWKIRIRGRDFNIQYMTGWTLTGSTGGALISLLTSTTRLRSTVQDSAVTIPASTACTTYRITALSFDSGHPTRGCSIFRYSRATFNDFQLLCIHDAGRHSKQNSCLPTREFAN